MLFDQFCLWSAEKELDFSLAFCVSRGRPSDHPSCGGGLGQDFSNDHFFFKCIGVDLRVTITLKITNVDLYIDNFISR